MALPLPPIPPPPPLEEHYKDEQTNAITMQHTYEDPDEEDGDDADECWTLEL